MHAHAPIDCVKLKAELQEQARRRYEGLSAQQRREAQQQFLESSDDELARWWREVRRAQAPTTSEPALRP